MSQPFLASAPGTGRLEGGIHAVAPGWLGAARPGGVAGSRAPSAAESARSLPQASRRLPGGHVMAAASLWASHDFLDLGSFVCSKWRTFILSICERTKLSGRTCVWIPDLGTGSRGWRRCGVNKQHPVLTEVRLGRGETANTQANGESIPSGGLQ